MTAQGDAIDVTGPIETVRYGVTSEVDLASTSVNAMTNECGRLSQPYVLIRTSIDCRHIRDTFEEWVGPASKSRKESRLHREDEERKTNTQIGLVVPSKRSIK